MVICGTCGESCEVTNPTEARLVLWFHALAEHANILFDSYPPKIGFTYNRNFAAEEEAK